MSNPNYKLQLLKTLRPMLRAERKLCALIRTNKNDSEIIENHGSWMLHWQATLDIVYNAFCGKNEPTVYRSFKADSYGNRELPIACYAGLHNKPGDGSISGKLYQDKPYTGFIPDVITDVIFDQEMASRQKLALLEAMFKDLENLQKEFSKKKVKRPKELK